MAKLLHKRIERVCRRKLRSGSLTEKQRDAVKAVLADQLGTRLLTERVAEIPAVVSATAEGERPVIDWLVANWETIFKIIMAIVAALGLL